MTDWLRAQHLTGWRWACSRGCQPFLEGLMNDSWQPAPRSAGRGEPRSLAERRKEPPQVCKRWHLAQCPHQRRVHTQFFIYLPNSAQQAWNICVCNYISNSSAISRLHFIPRSRLFFCLALFPVLTWCWLCFIICRQKLNNLYSFVSMKKIPERWNCMPQTCSWNFPVHRKTCNPVSFTESFLVCGLSFPTFNSCLTILNWGKGKEIVSIFFFAWCSCTPLCPLADMNIFLGLQRDLRINLQKKTPCN